MTKNNQKIRFFRERIPTFECKQGCHDCCGPVTASSEEMARFPVKSDEEHEVALAEYNCPYLGDNGCQVYDERPLICRLFGTTQRLPCPNDKRPTVMVSTKIEHQIHRFLAGTRQLLL
ncbi:MAG: YkgJ family cysteine cluster protein [Methylococcaceae bacterium]|nr:YkgJ family cysteine cluster protein [Methylococcaceae bacterium]MDZ4155030.1 YkgJ family cysteine cluster protein [Methylococcales bacterium]MDP2394525.1 YkgJ family cysteine cluster protein [Methylococcaceae bacterium]MDP3021568.1 YkgJ family cysteine cluster protein [Methylococcaceae bacterium]MDP3392068.1 YkgJ family cysteine cluster protein [Methylococcaceae bacterium]